MLEVFALTLPLFVKSPMDEFPYLPEDLCVDFAGIEHAAASECPEYYIVIPETGRYSPAPLPIPISHELAVLTNEGLRRGLLLLKKKSASN